MLPNCIMLFFKTHWALETAVEFYNLNQYQLASIEQKMLLGAEAISIYNVLHCINLFKSG